MHDEKRAECQPKKQQAIGLSSLFNHNSSSPVALAVGPPSTTSLEFDAADVSVSNGGLCAEFSNQTNNFFGASISDK
jgi:hypothetical protein